MSFMLSFLLVSFNCLFTISPEEKELLIGINEIPFYASERHLSLEEFQANESLLLHYDKSFLPIDYNEYFEYWTKVQFCIESNTDQYLLEFFDQTIDSISVFLQKDSADYQVWHMGDQLYFEDKPVLHKNFQVLLDGAGEYKLYIRIKSRNYADIRFAVRSVDWFIQYAINEYYIYGLFYGMILIISLYNVSIFSAIREVKYIYYTFYVLSVGLFAMCIDGIAYQYLWPRSPSWNHVSHGVALFFVIFWAILFSKAFLTLKARGRNINKLLNAVLIIRTAIFLYALFIDNSVFNYRNIEIIPLLLIFVGSLIVFRRGYQPARFFIVAYGFLFLGFLLKALISFSDFPLSLLHSQLFQIISYYSLHICFVFEMLFLSLALSDRVRVLKDKKDRAIKRIVIQHQENIELKDKINQELEDRILQRTEEIAIKNKDLEEINLKLNIQTEEINAINSKLDLDNWKLRNDIKDILQDRLINKNLNYEKFREIFPNELACNKFLEKLKWNRGYECIKCKNTKYAKGHAKFSRRCSKCGYDESITSNTVFNRIKFPIEKAFFILYVVRNQPDEFTLDQLSDLLDLRRNTIWNFKKKLEKNVDQSSSKSINYSMYQIFTSPQK